MTKDYYKILGVDKKASTDEIKKAYKKLAMQHHPDRGGDENVFKEINEAHEILKDNTKRSNYDIYGDPNGQPGFKSGNNGGWAHRSSGRVNIEELLRKAGMFHRGRGDPFGGDEDIFSHVQRHTPKDINVNYEITLEEAFTGKQVSASINLPDQGKKKLDVTIPAGFDTGQRIRFPGAGIKSHPNAQAGDVYITIQVQPHIIFKRAGQNLYTNTTVNVIDAMLGTQTQIKGIDGTMLSLNIPAGTQHGAQFRLRGQGFSIQGMTNRGDLIVTVNLEVPKSLRPEEEALLRQLKTLQNTRQ